MTLSRRNVLIAAIAGTWLVLLILTFFLVRSAQQNRGASLQKITPSPQIARPANEDEKANLLYDQAEAERAERDYNTKVGKSGAMATPQQKFNFKLAPSLQNVVSPTPEALRRVLGVASMCNIDSAPATVTVYDLKSHWLADEAQNLALEFGVDSVSYSLPTDASSYQYQFTSKNNASFFSLFEASGLYKYHVAGVAGSTVLDAASLREKASTFMTNHKLNGKVAPPVVSTTAKGSGIFSYKRVLDEFKITDHAGVAGATSLCSVPETVEAGDILVEVRKDGVVTNLENNTRAIINSYTANRLSLQEAVAEYHETQPVKPIVLPEGSNVNAGDVTIESAVLAYYDVGSNFGQELYIPIYIARGIVGSVQVTGFFPAVSATEMLKKGLVKAIPKSGNAATQQQGTLPFATPTLFLPPPPPASGPVSNEPGGPITGPGCPGGLVDYSVKCSVAGRTVCIGLFSADSKTDPLGACNSACKSAEGAVAYKTSTSPCEDFLNSKGVPPSDDGVRSGNIDRTGLKDGDQVSCSVRGCPC